jgi:hypothetical protein
MGRGRPEAEVGQDVLDHDRLFNKCDDPHGSGAAGTHEWIDFIDLLDEPGPGTLRGRARDFGELRLPIRSL